MSKPVEEIIEINLKNEDEIKRMLAKLRKQRPSKHKIKWEGITTGQRISDVVASVVGSWKFIIIQSVLLSLWIVINIMSWIKGWDPYPFILLNLLLSFQAAFTAPIIMMSQNRQNQIDRQRAEGDYKINIKAELEIEALHQKIDLLRETEIKQLIDIIRSMEKRLQ
jgi:uncharacterized membrane protein